VKSVVMVCTAFTGLRTGTSGELLWPRKWTLECRASQDNYYLPESLLTVLRGITWLSSEISWAVILDPFFFYLAHHPQWARASLFTRISRSHSTTQHSRTPLDKSSTRRRDLFLTIHNTHKRQKSMPPVGFENNLSRRATSDLRLRPRGHWDRLLDTNSTYK